MSSVTNTAEFNGLVAAGVFSGAILLTIVGVFVHICYRHYQAKIEKERIQKMKSKHTAFINGAIRNGGPPKAHSKPPFKRTSGARRSQSTTRSLPYPVRGRPMPPGHVMALPTYAGGMSTHYGYGPMLHPYPPISDWEHDSQYTSDSLRSTVSHKHRKKQHRPKASDAVRPPNKGKKIENGIKPREMTVFEKELKGTGKDNVDSNANELNLLQGEIILHPQNSPMPSLGSRHSPRNHENDIRGDNWTYSNVIEASRFNDEEASQNETTVELRKTAKKVEPRFSDPRHHIVAKVESEIKISSSKFGDNVTTDISKPESERDSVHMNRDISWYFDKQVEIIENTTSNNDDTVLERQIVNNAVTKPTESVVTNSNFHEQIVDLEDEPKIDYNMSLESPDLLRILQHRRGHELRPHPSSGITERPDSPPPLSRSSPKERHHFGFSYITRDKVDARQRDENDGVNILPPEEDVRINSKDIAQRTDEIKDQIEATGFPSVLAQLKQKQPTIDGDDDYDSEDSTSAQRNLKSVQFSQKPPVVIPAKARTPAPQLQPIHTKARVVKRLTPEEEDSTNGYIPAPPSPPPLGNIPVPPPLPPSCPLKKL